MAGKSQTMLVREGEKLFMSQVLMVWEGGRQGSQVSGNAGQVEVMALNSYTLMTRESSQVSGSNSQAGRQGCHVSCIDDQGDFT